MEADLRREYGEDLCDLWRGKLTLRKLRVYLDGLPITSATTRAMAGMDPTHPLAQWSLTDVLVARLVDEVAAHRWQWETAHSKPGRRRKPPESVMPEPPRTPRAEPDSNVIPLVSPHKLGNFVNDPEEVTPDD